MSIDYSMQSTLRVFKHTPSQSKQIQLELSTITDKNQKEAHYSPHSKKGNQSSTKKIKKPYELKTAIFEDGWWVHYTDNYNHLQSHNSGQTQSDKVLLLNHGLPGSPRDFAKLQEHLFGFCRIIFFWLPGFDGHSEQRGNYIGDRHDAAYLMKRLQDYLQIPKVVVQTHSGSTTYGKEFIFRYRERVEGVVELCSSSSHWGIGIQTYWTNIVLHTGIYKGDVDLDDFATRNRLYEKYVKRIAGLHFDGIWVMPQDIYGFIAFIKVMKFYGQENCEYWRNVGRSANKQHCLVATTDDKLQNKWGYMDYFHEVLKNTSDLGKQLLVDNGKVRNIRREFEKDEEQNKFDVENLQRHHIYMLKTGGHQVMIHRAEECSFIIKKFIKSLELLEKGLKPCPNL